MFQLAQLPLISSLTALSLNSEHTSFEMNTQLWETGRIRITIPILQEAEVRRASIFYFPLAGYVSAGHREECKLGVGGDVCVIGLIIPQIREGLITSSCQMSRNVHGWVIHTCY